MIPANAEMHVHSVHVVFPFLRLGMQLLTRALHTKKKYILPPFELNTRGP
jgi:hypothetical protein